MIYNNAIAEQILCLPYSHILLSHFGQFGSTVEQIAANEDTGPSITDGQHHRSILLDTCFLLDQMISFQPTGPSVVRGLPSASPEALFFLDLLSSLLSKSLDAISL